MSTSNPLARCLSAAAVISSILLIASPAEAAVVGSFDPAFGPSIPNLGFRGSITFEVAPGCYGTPGYVTVSIGGGCQVTVDGAQVNYYNSTTNSANIAGSTVNLLPAAFGTNGSGYVTQLFINANNMVAGIASIDSAPFAVSVMDTNPAAPINYTGSMVLYFRDNFNQIGSFAAQPAVTGVGGAYLRNCNGTQGSCANGTSSLPGTLTFTNQAVPEPGTVALVALGLGALVATRRRRAR